MTAIRQRARRQRRRGLDIIIIDHLQPIRQGGRQDRGGSKWRCDIEPQSLAKDLSVPVLLVSQIARRSSATLGARTPPLGRVVTPSRDADVVLFLYREEYYLSAPRSKTWQRDARGLRGATGRFGRCPDPRHRQIMSPKPAWPPSSPGVHSTPNASASTCPNGSINHGPHPIRSPDAQWTDEAAGASMAARVLLIGLWTEADGPSVFA